MLKLAFQFILYDKAKSFGALMGVIISVFLIGQQVGIFLALTGNMSRLVDGIGGDVWVVDNRTTDINSLGRIDARLGREVESIAGVDRAYPVVITGSTLRVPGGNPGNVQLIGSEPPAMIAGPFMLNKGTKNDLLEDGAITMDVFDKNAWSGAGYGSVVEVGGKRATIRATTRGARGFGGLYSFTTLARARALGNFGADNVSAFIVKAKKDSSTARLVSRINSHLYGVRAWETKKLSAATVSSVLSRSGIATSVGTLVVFALISGVFIIGLTLYSSAVDRIRDYGTLKAIGATNMYISTLILLQAFLFGLIGYGIGSLLLQGFAAGIANVGLLVTFSPTIRIALFAITMVIALGGAIFAVRRINSVEPAAVFRM